LAWGDPKIVHSLHSPWAILLFSWPFCWESRYSTNQTLVFIVYYPSNPTFEPVLSWSAIAILMKGDIDIGMNTDKKLLSHY
jgi:hypothetical protein